MKKHEVGAPHGEQKKNADYSELKCDHEHLIMRIIGDGRRMCLRGRIAPEQLKYRSCAMPQHRCGRNETSAIFSNIQISAQRV